MVLWVIAHLGCGSQIHKYNPGYANRRSLTVCLEIKFTYSGGLERYAIILNITVVLNKPQVESSREREGIHRGADL